ncbi:glycosyltransferase family 4 protein [Sulfurivermis fontis]|jgi:glycosyltransferase involved in cell wall biosynthesis|uniref:glycosyltransferase family 4 protein n=1 Tax=Sulfurivermis fontis TaxID=1972068 RepID=UPI000FDB9ECD|nr:glycosyltransferase family 4 protein [Sulfurivermis fontis]
MKVAIVHDWLVTYAGAERVLEAMLDCFPEAELFSLVDFIPPGQRDFIKNKSTVTSFIQNLPFSRRKYRNYLAWMPLAVEQFDLSGYDLVISSSHAVAKGVLTGPDQLHICMCYSPIRYAWDLQHQYLREAGLERGLKGWIAKWMLHRIRLWDMRTANGVDEFIAISDFIARRIWKVYRRESTVIYPPVDVGGFQLREAKEDFYVTASRMVPYKKIDLIVEAFSSMPARRLIVIGDGPDFEKIRARAGSNVEFLGFQEQAVLRDYLQRARAFVFAAEEDFGIAPLEAQACGTPVIAYGKGGVLETVVGMGTGTGNNEHAPTGIFFDRQSVASLRQAVESFESHRHLFHPIVCRTNAERFSPERFRSEFMAFVAAAVGRSGLSWVCRETTK